MLRNSSNGNASRQMLSPSQTLNLNPKPPPHSLHTQMLIETNNNINSKTQTLNCKDSSTLRIS